MSLSCWPAQDAARNLSNFLQRHAAIWSYSTCAESLQNNPNSKVWRCAGHYLFLAPDHHGQHICADPLTPSVLTVHRPSAAADGRWTVLTDRLSSCPERIHLPGRDHEPLHPYTVRHPDLPWKSELLLRRLAKLEKNFWHRPPHLHWTSTGSIPPPSKFGPML